MEATSPWTEGPLNSSVKMDWMTPDVVLDLVRGFDVIGLDPATSEDNPTGARHFYTPADDGLSCGWGGYGLVFVNPAYGRALKSWAGKCAIEAETGLAEIIALVPARTDTRWFRQLADRSQSILFWSGRLTFKGAPAPAPFPSALVYFGPRKRRFGDVFAARGWLR